MRETSSRQHGFTAIELITVMAIVGILAALALPSMRTMVMTQKVRSLALDLFADLTYARSEAISRSRDVQVQSIGGGTDWSGGWTINDVTATPAQQLKIHACSGSPCVVTSGVGFTANVASVTFDRTGRASGTSSFSIVSNDAGATNDQKRCVKLDTSGRPRSSTGACP